MLYNLPNGKTIEISLEQYLLMSDEDIEYLIAYNIGSDVENAFRSSSLSNVGSQIDEYSPEDDDPRTLDLTELTPEEKLSDLDLDLPLED